MINVFLFSRHDSYDIICWDKANEAAIAADNALQAAAEAAAADPDNADKQNARVEAKNQAAVAQKFKTSANITLSKAKAASAKSS